MPKSDNPHAIRLNDSLLKHSELKPAESIHSIYPLSKAADIEKKFVWAEAVCDYLEKNFDDETIKKIRMDCACGPEIGKINKLKKVYSGSASLYDFTSKLTVHENGFSIWNEGEDLFLAYPTCYCSCVKRIDKPLSKTWCYCTLGYTKKMFEHILNYEVEVNLLESIKTGGSKCVIKISKK